MKVYLLTTGSGEDGDEWCLLGIYSTYELAVGAKAEYKKPREGALFGGVYSYEANIKDWLVDEPK